MGRQLAAHDFLVRGLSHAVLARLVSGWVCGGFRAARTIRPQRAGPLRQNARARLYKGRVADISRALPREVSDDDPDHERRTGRRSNQFWPAQAAVRGVTVVQY